MELRQLEYFVAVAEERHFTRAAARVHVVQSTLSSAVRALERELGSELLARSSRRVELTEAGRALLPAARRALAAAEEGRDAVAAVRGLLRGRLAIGVVQSLGLVDLPALVTRFHQRHPAVTLRLSNDAVPELVRATVEGELDLAFVDRPLDDRLVRAVPLGVEPVVLAVAAADPLAERDSVRLVELASRDFVEYRADSALRARVDASCAAVGLRRRMCCEVDTIADLVELVAGGLGVAFVPPRALRPAAGRVVGLRTDPVVPRELAVVTASHRPPAPAAAALLAMLPKTAADLEPG